MSRAIVGSLQATFNRSFGMFETFITVCPWEIWTAPFGGWPVWQQAYHAVSSIEFFVLGVDEQRDPSLFETAIRLLEQTPPKELAAPSRAAMQEYAVVMKNKAAKYIDTLSDADLAANNPGLSARMNAEITHAMTLSMLDGHTLYHLGACDAALRERGLKGVF